MAALAINPDNPAALNRLAWLHATCPLEELRDGAAAVRDARRACELTGYQMPSYLDTLAAAFAELGRFDDAVYWQEQAIQLAPDELRSDYESRLPLYKAGQPYRETKPVI